MQRATRDTQWLTASSGELLGIALGWDFSGHHQFGIKKLRDVFELPEGHERGVESRKIRAVPKTLMFTTYLRQPRCSGRRTVPARKCGVPPTQCALLVGHAYWMGSDSEALNQARENVDFWLEPGDSYYDPTRDDLSAAWDDSSFAVLVRGPENCSKLKAIHEAFEKCDIVVGAGQDFGLVRSFGVSFVIDSRIDEATRATVLADDLEHISLLEAAEATGIEKRLTEAGKLFSTLRPGWANKEKTAVRFFLHPLQQSRYRSGWFSVADLDAWARDEGPVLVKKTAG